MKKACVLLAEGFEEVEALTPVDFFRRAGIEVITAGIGGAEIKGSHGIEVRADVVLSASLKDFDCVVVPGGMPGSKNIAASDLACKLIVRSFESGALVAAICAAPVVVLGPAGLLKGRRFTCYPGMEKDAAGGLFSGERVVIDGNLITGRAAGCAGEFSLSVIRSLLGKGTGDKVREATLSRP